MIISGKLETGQCMVDAFLNNAKSADWADVLKIREYGTLAYAVIQDFDHKELTKDDIRKFKQEVESLHLDKVTITSCVGYMHEYSGKVVQMISSLAVYFEEKMNYYNGFNFWCTSDDIKEGHSRLILFLGVPRVPEDEKTIKELDDYFKSKMR